MDTFELEIATPRREVLRTRARQLQVPAATGEMGILPAHAPLLANLGTGLLSYQSEEGEERRLVISGGFLEVLPERATLLADLAETAEEIDAAQARQDLERAENAFRHPAEGQNPLELQRELTLAQARVSLLR